jgi:hypothetical protein
LGFGPGLEIQKSRAQRENPCPQARCFEKSSPGNATPTIHKIPLIPPLPKGEIVIPLFGKEGRGEIF